MRYTLFLSTFLGLLATVTWGEDSLYPQKQFCDEAVRTGNVAAAEELGKMLLDVRMNTNARTALENLPNAAGLPVLRAALGKMSEPNCLAGILQSLGNQRDATSIPAIGELLKNDASAPCVRAAALKALGRIATEDSLAQVKAFLNAPQQELRRAAADGMFFAAEVFRKENQKEKERACYQAVLDAGVDEPTSRIAKANLASAAGIALLPAVTLDAVWKERPDATVWDRITAPTPQDLENYLKTKKPEDFSSDDVQREAANLCLRMDAKEEAFAKLQAFCVQDLLPVVRIAELMGIPESLVILERLAWEGEDHVMDAATQVLGAWPTYDVAPLLMRLAMTHPVEKYRIRLLRGYIRILKRWDIAILEKKQMCHAVLAVATRAEEREMVEPILASLNQRLPEKALFNGKDFTGWEGREDIFQVLEGGIVGGSMEKPLGKNEFLTTKERFGDFYLRLEAKIVGEKGNAGIQFRSERIPNNHEMIGYQADMTSDGGYWGCLYDESRRRKMLQTAPPEIQKAVWKPGEWTRYEILCDGPIVKLFVNGVQTVEYSELDDSIPKTGLLGLQIHAGPPAQSSYRNIFITTK